MSVSAGIMRAVARALCEANGKPPVAAIVNRYHKFASAAVEAHLKVLADTGYVVVRRTEPGMIGDAWRSAAAFPAGGAIVQIPRYGPGRID